jgi:hypothetical protein
MRFISSERKFCLQFLRNRNCVILVTFKVINQHTGNGNNLSLKLLKEYGGWGESSFVVTFITCWFVASILLFVLSASLALSCHNDEDKMCYKATSYACFTQSTCLKQSYQYLCIN